MQGILHEAPTIRLFLLLTVLLGGAASFQMGRAVAQTWRPVVTLLAYAVPMAAAVRFLHFALFQGTLLSAHYYLIDLIVVLAFAGLGYRRRRTEQMITQYAFAFAGQGPFGWKRKG